MTCMIPDLPKSVTQIDALAFYSDILSNLEDQSTIHTNWHTHKQNPAVCWICDMTILLSKVLEIAISNYTKSTVDIETDEVQVETESVPEIENDNFEVDNEPEYDVEDGEMET